MTKVTINPSSPKGAATTDAEPDAPKKTVADVVDGLGRTLTIKKLRAIDQMRLRKIVGADYAKNEEYLGYCALAYSIVAINGEPEGVAGSARQLEALVDRLDDEGMQAIGLGHAKHFGVTPLTDEDIDALKNL